MLHDTLYRYLSVSLSVTLPTESAHYLKHSSTKHRHMAPYFVLSLQACTYQLPYPVQKMHLLWSPLVLKMYDPVCQH